MSAASIYNNSDLRGHTEMDQFNQESSMDVVEVDRIPRVLVCKRKLDPLLRPLQRLSKIKCDCVAVSSKFLCVGSSTGSVHLFRRDNLEHVRFFSHNGNGVCALRFSNDGNILAVGDCDGHVSCWEIHEDKAPVQLQKKSYGRHSSAITDMCWDKENSRLFVGDATGLVTGAIVYPLKLKTKSFLTKATVEIIVQEKHAVVQLDIHNQMLLVSTTNRCVLCLIEKSQFCQIGSRPRDGFYGACFGYSPDCEDRVIYSARPGARLWEANPTGAVLSTHQYKKAINSNTAEIINSSSLPIPNSQITAAPNFKHLLQLREKFLISTSNSGLCVIDTMKRKLIACYRQIRDSHDICCYEDDIYIIQQDSTIVELSFLLINDSLHYFIASQSWQQAAQIISQFSKEIIGSAEYFAAIDFAAVANHFESSSNDDDEEISRIVKETCSSLENKQFIVYDKAILSRVDSSNDFNDKRFARTTADEDDAGSIISGAASETSNFSQMNQGSATRDIQIDDVLQKTASVIVSKILSTGILQRTLEEAKYEPVTDIKTTPTSTLSFDEQNKPTLPTAPIKEQISRRKVKVVCLDADENTQQQQQQPYQQVKKRPIEAETKVNAEEPSPSIPDMQTHQSDACQITDADKQIASTKDVIQNGSVCICGKHDHRSLPDLEIKPVLANHLNNLADVTVRTRNAIYSYDLLINKSKLANALISWSRTLLDEYFNFLLMSCDDTTIDQSCLNVTIWHRSFYNNLGASFSEISSLAMLCLGGDLYPESCGPVYATSKVLLMNSCFNSGTALCQQIIADIRHHHQQQKQQKQHGNSSVMPLSKSLLYLSMKSFLCHCKTSNCLECKIDERRACFVSHFFPLLNLSRLRTILNLKLGCRWRTYYTCLWHLQDLHRADDKRRQLDIKALLMSPGGMDLFLGSTQYFYQRSAEEFYKILFSNYFHSWEIILIYFCVNKTTIHSKDEFLRHLYLNVGREELNDVLQDSALMIFILEATIARHDGSSVSPSDDETYFSLDDIMEYGFDTSDAEQVNLIMRICYRTGYLDGYIKSAACLGNFKDCLQVIASLQNKTILESFISQYHEMVKIEDWISLLKQINICKQADSHYWFTDAIPTNQITIHDVLSTLALHVNQNTFIQILKNASASSLDVPMEMFMSSLMDDERQRNMAKTVDILADSLNVALWMGESQNTISSQIMEMKNEEMQKLVSGSNENDAVNLKSFENHIESKKDLSWGITADLSSLCCGYCSLPFCMQTASSGSGLSVFTCGHVFHRRCIDDDACPSCCNFNLFSLNSYA